MIRSISRPACLVTRRQCSNLMGPHSRHFNPNVGFDLGDQTGQHIRSVVVGRGDQHLRLGEAGTAKRKHAGRVALDDLRIQGFLQVLTTLCGFSSTRTTSLPSRMRRRAVRAATWPPPAIRILIARSSTIHAGFGRSHITQDAASYWFRPSAVHRKTAIAVQVESSPDLV